MSEVTISAFGDEIAESLEDQLSTIQDLNIRYLECRMAWGTRINEFSDEQARRVRQLCDEAGIEVSCMGTPIGKSPLADPLANELAALDRIMAIGEILGTKNVRIFSFYPPDEDYDSHVQKATDYLAALTEKASTAGYQLLLENEKGIVTDTPERCHAVLSAIDSPALRFIWDPANFVQVGVANLTDEYWDLLHSYIGYVHIKDALLADGTVKPAGQGDGQIPELLTRLKDTGYSGMLALEPHLAIAGHSGGFSGVDGMTLAVGSLRQVMAEVGLEEG